jgi:hypothetical protein
MKNLLTALLEVCVLITITGFCIDSSHNFNQTFVSLRIDSAKDEIKSYNNIHSDESAAAYIIINGRIDDYNRANLQLAAE